MGLVNKFKEELGDIKSGLDYLDAHLARKLPTMREIYIDWGAVYRVGGLITAALVFIACWAYAVLSWGFLLGVGLGWIPSLFIAVIAGFIWPLLALALVVGIGVIAFLLYRT
jgi:hypothetical protein